MPGIRKTHNRNPSVGVQMSENRTAIGKTDPVKLSGEVAVQLTGVATAIAIQMNRSTVDPLLGTPNWAPVGPQITGNPGVNIQVQGYFEPAAAWWCADLISITGASVDIDVSGGFAP